MPDIWGFSKSFKKPAIVVWKYFLKKIAVVVWKVKCGRSASDSDSSHTWVAGCTTKLKIWNFLEKFGFQTNCSMSGRLHNKTQNLEEILGKMQVLDKIKHGWKSGTLVHMSDQLHNKTQILVEIVGKKNAKIWFQKDIRLGERSVEWVRKKDVSFQKKAQFQLQSLCCSVWYIEIRLILWRPSKIASTIR